MLDNFFTFLRFQTISSSNDHKNSMIECSSWLRKFIENIGMKVEIWETAGHPIVFANHMAAGPDKPTVLIYNHYDVQPVNPLEEWISPPFEPTIRDGEIFARGAQDNKGQCFGVLWALKTIMDRDGALPINIKLCIEGEEEIGSPGLSNILNDKSEALSADYLIVADVGIPSIDTPAVTLGARGIITMTITLQGSNGDLHSGTHGGMVYNPHHALVELLAKLRDSSGRIAIPGFYDDVASISEKERALISFDLDQENYKNAFGTAPSGGEKNFSPIESAWIRPTLEINGISGGHSGSGFKTVIPCKVEAKLSCRLVPNQDPDTIGKLVSKFLEDNLPDDITMEIIVHPGVGDPIRTKPDSSIVHAAANAYEEVFKKKCIFVYDGGSVPISSKLAKASNSDVVMMGLGLPDDNIHAPNEHFGAERLEMVAQVFTSLLSKL